MLTYIPIAEGLAAGEAGLASLENPYAMATEEGVRWHAGWMEGCIANARGERTQSLV